MKTVRFIKSLIWILVGLLIIIFSLRTYIKMVKKFMAGIIILLAGVISSFWIYKKAKWIKSYLRTESHTMRDELKKRNYLRNAKESWYGKNRHIWNSSLFKKIRIKQLGWNLGKVRPRALKKVSAVMKVWTGSRDEVEQLTKENRVVGALNSKEKEYVRMKSCLK